MGVGKLPLTLLPTLTPHIFPYNRRKINPLLSPIDATATGQPSPPPICPATDSLLRRSRGWLDLEGAGSQVCRRSWIARGEEKSTTTKRGLHASPSLRRREKALILSELRRQPYFRAEDLELWRMELGDLINLVGREQNSTGRSELVVEDQASSEEEERNRQWEKRERDEVFGENKN
ncbi:hypothetical protein TIFTF001_052138 [Ficus carica]|uniref:Uncharacterized protein n=1 Tax=Ficus carica TaxID=3494 RepID=A0AA88EEE6_FICCA|nr:hypothetical protein TIFTF001_052138 [Ficus carica]